jgi:glutathione peroxidase
MFRFLSSIFTPRGKLPPGIHDFKVQALDGGTIDFGAFRGRKILIVNTASLCGKTPQYEGLERLYRRYQPKLVVIGFPCNNFLFQEPGSNARIADFCRTQYHITFPMAAKVSVKGFFKAPIYRWLTEKRFNGMQNSTVTWNFQKYLINEQGRLTHVFSPGTEPEDPSIIAAIEA